MSSYVKTLRQEHDTLTTQIDEAKQRDDYEAAAAFSERAAETLEELADEDDTIEELETERRTQAEQHRVDATIFAEAARKDTESEVGRDGGPAEESVPSEEDVDEELISRWVDGTPDLTFDDVGGMDDLKRSLERNVIMPLERPDLFAHYDLGGIGGIYLHGESGTGKSYFSKALAGELSERFDGGDEWSFISVSPADVMSELVGKPARKLREVFTVARSQEPCVLFFDECDGLFPSRDRRGVTGNERQLVNEALTQMIETNESDASVLVVGATNHLDIVDDAMKSTHRFQRTVAVPMPDPDSREAVLRKHLRNRPTELTSRDVEWFRDASHDLSAADVAEVADTAARRAVDEALEDDTRPPVSRTHLEAALRRVE